MMLGPYGTARSMGGGASVGHRADNVITGRMIGGSALTPFPGAEPHPVPANWPRSR